MHKRMIWRVPSIFPGYSSIHRKIVTFITNMYDLIQTHYKCIKFSLTSNVANRVAFNVASDILPVWWMEVHPLCFNQSNSLLNAKIKSFIYTYSVFRVFFAIAFTGITIGQSSSFLPDYSKAKHAAALVFKTLDTVPAIDVYSSKGTYLVCTVKPF